PERLQFRDKADTTMEAIVRQALFARTLETRAEALGLSLDEARSLMAPVDLETVSTQPPEEEEEDNEAGQGLGALSAIVLLMAITFYGQWVVVGVIEEKSNRVVEVLLAAVTPGELLVGKVLGILALALIQIVLAAVALVAALVVVEGPDALPVIALAALGMATLWLIIGLLLYNFLYAAVGATASRSEEATSVTVPLMIPLMAGYFGGVIAIPQDPDSLLSRFISIFPLTAPLTMPSRISAGGGSPIEVVIAAVLTLLSLAAVIWIATRIYSGGILQSSKVGLLAAFRRTRE
ncbi:MAG: ABC transporter permease, partial [Dehalococcoidia bacterium]